MIREAIVKLVHKENLTYEMAEGAMDEIMGGKADPIQISAFLTAMTMKGETIEEITACANGMRKHGIHIEHPCHVPCEHRAFSCRWHMR